MIFYIQLIGKYKGLFSNDRMPGQWFETEMFLTVQLNGIVTGNGSDRTGRFSVQGRINGNVQVQFIGLN